MNSPANNKSDSHNYDRDDYNSHNDNSDNNNRDNRSSYKDSHIEETHYMSFDDIARNPMLHQTINTSQKITLVPELDVEDIRRVLAQVPDPEVPVLTLEDLGIIRDVVVDKVESSIIVTLTPTYIGCPATLAIQDMVSQALIVAGYPQPIIKEQLTPAWRTEWISESGKAKLHAYGIAPPSPHDKDNAPLQCPHCGSNHYDLVSQFGATACKSLYRCLNCKEPFEYFKCL